MTSLGFGAYAQGAASDEFLAWAHDALHPLASAETSESDSDLARMGRMVGDARIVAFSEALHGAAEPLAFRNRLFKYLVREHGFKAIAIESGIVESEILDDYILGGRGELADALARGLSWNFEILPQNAELIRWMRAYNATRAVEEKPRIYGFDVPGSPDNTLVTQGPEVALERVLRYLSGVDADSAVAFTKRFGRYLPRLKADYSQIEQADRDALTVAIPDLNNLMELSESEYTARSNTKEYDWVLRAAVGARQVDSWLRQFPVGHKQSDGPTPVYLAGRLRDRAMADNLDWIVQQLGADSRVLVFGALSHLSTAPITYVETTIDSFFGIHAKRRYRDQFLTVGMLTAGGAIGNCPPAPRMPLIDAPPASINGQMKRLASAPFVLDLRAAPPGTQSWLSDVRDVWSGFNVQKLRLRQALDLLVFVESYSPGCK